jgi:hypothetical protein
VTLDVITAARRRTRRRLTVIAGIGAGAAALVYPAGLWVNAHLNDQAVSTPATVTAPWPATTSPVTVLPADVTSVRVAGVELPVSASAGPRDSVGGLVRGFAHTPGGAVLAAVHLVVRTTPQVGPRVFEPTLRDQVVGPNAAAMREFVAQLYQQATAAGQIPYGQPIGDLPAAFAGFRLDKYTDHTADVALLTTAIDATGVARYATTTVHLSWTGTDWALLAPDGGRWDAEVRILDPAHIAGYTPLLGR